MNEARSDKALLDSEAPDEDLWHTPEQGKEPDNELRMKGVRKMFALVEKEFEPTGTLPGKIRIYVPKMPNERSALGRMTLTKPPDAYMFPGYDVWELMTNANWMNEVTDMAKTSGFEMMDLQSDLTLALSVLIDDAYSKVPPMYKYLFVALTIMSILLELAIAFGEAWKSYMTQHKFSKTWSYLGLATFLNWVAAPVFLMIAPLRMDGFGSHKLGRNIGSCKECEGMPILMIGQSGNIDYLRSRTFLVRLPKVFFENILLFALTVYIQFAFVGEQWWSWSAAAYFSLGCSLISLIMALVKTCQFVIDAYRAKRFWEKTVADTQRYLNEYDVNFARGALSQGFLSCPLL